MSKTYTLLGVDGFFESDKRGLLGGHKKNGIYGQMECSSARLALAKGTYQKNRVFFADEAAAIASGFRPCGTCMRPRHKVWKAGGTPGTREYPWLVLPK